MFKLKTSLWGYSKNEVDNYTKELEQNYKMEMEVLQREYDEKKAILRKQIEELENKINL